MLAGFTAQLISLSLEPREVKLPIEDGIPATQLDSLRKSHCRLTRAD
jgi:hypothetical protein